MKEVCAVRWLTLVDISTKITPEDFARFSKVCYNDVMEFTLAKTKKILGFSLIIVFSVGLGFYVLAQVENAINKNVFGDTDQDGLSDTEEKAYGTNPSNADTDNDGYSDGIELKGGYDPLKPAPNDKLAVQNTNEQSGSEVSTLTSSLAEKIRTLVEQKNSANESISVDELSSVVTGDLETKVGPQITFETLPAVERKDLKIKEQDYDDLSDEEKDRHLKEDNEKYLKDILYIIFTNSPKIIQSQDDFTSFQSEFSEKLSGLSSDDPDYDYFRNFASKLEIAVEQAKATEVPESLLDVHIKLIQLTNGYLALRDPSLPGIEDPTTRIIIMSRAKMLMELTYTFFQEFKQAIGTSE